MTTANVGGGIGATVIDGSVPGQMFFTMASQPAAVTTQYTNVKWQQTNTSGTYQAASLYLGNGCADNTASGALSAVSTSASDAGGAYLTVYLMNSSGVGTTDTLLMNGTTTVTGVIAAAVGGFLAVDLRNSGGTLIAAVGTISLYQGTQLMGVIPAGQNSAVWCVQFGIDTALNTTGTIANPATAPASIAFSKPNTAATALALPATMNAGDYITIWGRWTLPAGAPAMPLVQTQFLLPGNAAA